MHYLLLYLAYDYHSYNKCIQLTFGTIERFNTIHTRFSKIYLNMAITIFKLEGS